MAQLTKFILKNKMCFFFTIKDDEDLREAAQVYGRHIIFLHTTVEIFQPKCAANVEYDERRGSTDFRL
jgi:hypothetical protein